jgi:membrane protein DedA with SNARE-associated domain
MPIVVLASLIPHRAEHFLQHYGWLALFVLVFVQDVGIPTGVPGTVLILFGGYLVFIGTINLHVAALSLAAGAFLGASAMFALAKFGGRPVVLKVGRFIGLTEARLNTAAGSLERWGPPMLLITRVAPGTRVYMTLFAGISGWTYRRFAFWTGIFVILWAYGFVIIGDALGKRWEHIARFILRFGYYLVILVIILVVAYVINTILTNRRTNASALALGNAADGGSSSLVMLAGVEPNQESSAMPHISDEVLAKQPTSMTAHVHVLGRVRLSKSKQREQRHANPRPRW